MVINIDEINKLQAQNKGLIEQNRQLQQDISTLQGKLDAFQMSENEANEIIAELKAENASLKSCLEIQRTDETKQYIEKVNFERENYKLKAENERLKEEIKEYKKRSKCAWKCFEGTLCEEGEKYKTCLQEIKTIAENIIIAYTNIAKSNEKLKAFDLRNRLQQILQKITKAEEK